MHALEIPRPVVRYALFGALFGSLFAVIPDAYGREHVLLAANVAGHVPLARFVTALMIPTLMCTVWAVAVARRFWPLAAVVGFSVGQMLIDPILSRAHLSYPAGLNVPQSAGFLMVGVSILIARRHE